MPSITVEPCTFALFGALGDLALRKLFPALYQLDGAGLLHDDTRILVLDEPTAMLTPRETNYLFEQIAHLTARLGHHRPRGPAPAAPLR